MIRTVRPETARYHIEEFLGEGAMAQVYKAIRVDSRGFSRQTVALKVLKSEKQVSCLVQEMETLMRVRSPHCVSLLGWENLPEGPAIVMEWVNGVSLESLTNSMSLDPSIVTEIVAQIQLGLADLKEANLCHGDLSLSNVLIDVQGKVRLVDFGLSLSDPEDVVVGTAQFMAPERWQGRSPTIESDLFSLGLILHDLTSGRLRRAEPPEHWRERTTQVATETSGWLAKVPGQRSFVTVSTNVRIQQQLAKKVTNLILKRPFWTKTIGLAIETRSRAPVATCLLFVLCMLFPIAPFGESNRSRTIPSATLEIRTQKWVHIRLGLLDLGYSPLIRTNVPAGLHRIQWRSSVREGTKLISLGYGERKLLTDRDF